MVWFQNTSNLINFLFPNELQKYGYIFQQNILRLISGSIFFILVLVPLIHYMAECNIRNTLKRHVDLHVDFLKKNQIFWK